MTCSDANHRHWQETRSLISASPGWREMNLVSCIYEVEVQSEISVLCI